MAESQMLVSGFGDIYGLNYQVVFRIADILGIEIDAVFLRCLKAFEVAMVTAINKRTKDNLESKKSGR